MYEVTEKSSDGGCVCFNPTGRIYTLTLRNICAYISLLQMAEFCEALNLRVLPVNGMYHLLFGLSFGFSSSEVDMSSICC